VLLAERYQVKLGILTQPSAFSLTLGAGSNLAQQQGLAHENLPELIAKLQPNTRFELFLDDTLMMTGRLDGHSSSSPTGTLTVQGRDRLAPLHDAFLLQEQSYKDDTYLALVRKVLDSVGLQEAKLLTSNDDNRRTLTSKATRTTGSLRAVETLRITDENASGGTLKKHIQSKLGERAYEFLKRHLDRAGLFLWCTADGDFVLSEPNPHQAPLYRIQRSQGAFLEFSDVSDHQYQNDTTQRFSEVHVYTRGETRKAGRSTTVATVHDTEMEAWGFKRPVVLRDVNADTLKKAEYMGRRKMAEARRQGWRLSYTVAGHTAGSPLGGRVNWAPDTLIEVNDERLGIREEVFWVESVTFNGSPQATTTIDLMRPRDLIFGDAPT
jgi:prophage tail gpP-like protein